MNSQQAELANSFSTFSLPGTINAPSRFPGSTAQPSRASSFDGITRRTSSPGTTSPSSNQYASRSVGRSPSSTSVDFLPPRSNIQAASSSTSNSPQFRTISGSSSADGSPSSGMEFPIGTDEGDAGGDVLSGFSISDSLGFVPEQSIIPSGGLAVASTPQPTTSVAPSTTSATPPASATLSPKSSLNAPTASETMITATTGISATPGSAPTPIQSFQSTSTTPTSTSSSSLMNLLRSPSNQPPVLPFPPGSTQTQFQTTYRPPPSVSSQQFQPPAIVSSALPSPSLSGLTTVTRSNVPTGLPFSTSSAIPSNLSGLAAATRPTAIPSSLSGLTAATPSTLPSSPIPPFNPSSFAATQPPSSNLLQMMIQSNNQARQQMIETNVPFQTLTPITQSLRSASVVSAPYSTVSPALSSSSFTNLPQPSLKRPAAPSKPARGSGNISTSALQQLRTSAAILGTSAAGAPTGPRIGSPAPTQLGSFTSTPANEDDIINQQVIRELGSIGFTEQDASHITRAIRAVPLRWEQLKESRKRAISEGKDPRERSEDVVHSVLLEQFKSKYGVDGQRWTWVTPMIWAFYQYIKSQVPPDDQDRHQKAGEIINKLRAVVNFDIKFRGGYNGGYNLTLKNCGTDVGKILRVMENFDLLDETINKHDTVEPYDIVNNLMQLGQYLTKFFYSTSSNRFIATIPRYLAMYLNKLEESQPASTMSRSEIDAKAQLIYKIRRLLAKYLFFVYPMDTPDNINAQQAEFCSYAREVIAEDGDNGFLQRFNEIRGIYYDNFIQC